MQPTAKNELASRTTELVELSAFYFVEDKEQYDEAVEFLSRIQHMRKWINGVYKDAKTPLTKATRTLSEQQRAMLQPLANAEATVMSKIVNYRQSQVALDDGREAVTRSVEAPAVTERTSYSAQVIDFQALMMAVASQIMITNYDPDPAIKSFLTETFHPTPQCNLSLLEPSATGLNAMARSLKNDLDVIGVALEKRVTLISK